MRKTFVLLSLLFFIAGSCLADQRENTMINLLVPSGLVNNEMYFNISHKYYYDITKYKAEDEDVFAPVTSGANINLGLRYMIWEGIEAGFYYNGAGQEKRVSLSYNILFEELFLRAAAYVEYFNFNNPVPLNTEQNLVYMLSFQSEHLFDIVSLALNAGYDGWSQKAIAGAGVSVKFMDKYSVTGEWYPAFKNNSGGYSIGFKAVTYGHQFVFFAGNTAAQGVRNALSGGGETLHLGFNIQRLISF